MKTYSKGYSLIATQNITKNDIINLCNLLNLEYENFFSSDKCYFEPDPRGIIFKFENNSLWYKSIILHIDGNKDIITIDSKRSSNYIFIDYLLEQWINNNEIIINKNYKIIIFLKRCNGAPLFTIEELKIWENCFNEIGLEVEGPYPKEIYLNILDF